MGLIERKLIEQGRVKCLCGRRATGTTEGGEPECDDLTCHAAEEIERVRHQLAGAVEALRLIADPPMGDDYTAPREYAEWLRDQASRALTALGGQ